MPPIQEPALKPEVQVSLSATVYDDSVTELRWSEGGVLCRAWSNLNFNHLAGLGAIDTAKATYSLMLGLGNDTRAAVTGRNEEAARLGVARSHWHLLPPASRFSRTRSEYHLEHPQLAGPPSDTLRCLDALHEYHTAHRAALAAAYAQRMAAAAERARFLALHPPKPPDTVIHYWPEAGDALRAAPLIRKEGQ